MVFLNLCLLCFFVANQLLALGEDGGVVLAGAG
jgi:hypothetical protein